LEREIDQTPSDELAKEICQPLSGKSTDGEFYSHCLQNLLNASSLISKSISSLDGLIIAFCSVSVIPVNEGFF
jgi:hypothetical protein